MVVFPLLISDRSYYLWFEGKHKKNKEFLEQGL